MLCALRFSLLRIDIRASASNCTNRNARLAGSLRSGIWYDASFLYFIARGGPSEGGRVDGTKVNRPGSWHQLLERRHGSKYIRTEALFCFFLVNSTTCSTIINDDYRLIPASMPTCTIDTITGVYFPREYAPMIQDD